MKRAFTAAAFTVVMTLSGAAHAAPEAIDWNAGSGDKWITRDTATGLAWLDVSLTVDQTFDQVRLGEWYAKGFRHATQRQLQRLFLDAGTPDDDFDTSRTHPVATLRLMALLGVTSVGRGHAASYGFVGTDYFGNDIDLSNHPIGTPFPALLGKLDYMDLGSGHPRFVGEAHFTGGQPFSDEASPAYGSFLVYGPVPEPSTHALLAAGLALLAVRRRSRVHRA